MKKFRLPLIIGVTLFAGIFTAIKFNYTYSDNYQFVISNIEAMANGEGSGGGCYGTGSVVCDNGLHYYGKYY